MKKKGKKTYSEDYVVVMLEDLHDQFGAFGNGLKLLNEKIDNFENKVDSIASDVLDIKSKIGRKVDWDDFHKLEKKVFKLEKLVLSKL